MAGVRCAECGFVAVRDRTTRELAEVEVGLRKKWVLPTLPNSSYNRYEDFPLCVLHKASLRVETETYRPDDVIALLWLDRVCDGFMPWRHGFSPKEHLEMLFQDELRRTTDEQRARDKEWQDRRDAELRQWQESQAAAQQKWLNEQNEKNRAEYRANRRVHIFLTLAGIAVTCALAYFGYSVTRFGQPPVKNIPVEQHDR